MRHCTVLALLSFFFVGSAVSPAPYGVSGVISAHATVSQPVGMVDSPFQETGAPVIGVESSGVSFLLVGPRVGNIIVMIDGTEIPRERFERSLANIDQLNLDYSQLHTSSVITVVYCDN